MARLMYISPPHSAVVPQYEYQLSPPSSAVLDRPSLSAGLVQGGSARAEPDALSRTPVVTVGQPSANVAVRRPPSVKHRPTSAKLRILPAASVSVGERQSRHGFDTCGPWIVHILPLIIPLEPSKNLALKLSIKLFEE
ncbi:hypothetical protein EDD17DRAFT_1753126 [Pisolithus thermaeus]|nr:hypothetical protein EDD17DRAFT_1753126 [Pisolithus thermaeus]